MLFFEKSKLSYAIGRHESPTPSLNIINFSVYTSAISLSFVSELKFSCCTILIIMYDLVKIVSIVLEKSCWPTSSRIFSILLPLKQWAAEIAAAEDTGKIFNNNLREALWIDYTYSCSANNTLLTVGESSHWRILIGSGLVPTNNFSSVLLSTWTSINNSSDAAMKATPHWYQTCFEAHWHPRTKRFFWYRPKLTAIRFTIGQIFSSAFWNSYFVWTSNKLKSLKLSQTFLYSILWLFTGNMKT